MRRASLVIMAAIGVSSCAMADRSSVAQVFPSEPGRPFAFIEDALDTGLAANPISDCSDAVAFCLKGDAAELVVPKACERLTLGSVFAANGSSSKLLWIDEVVSHHLPNRFYWFGNPDHPSVVFTYTLERGVTQIVTSPSRENLVELAATGGLMRRLTTTRDLSSRGRPSDAPQFRCEQATLRPEWPRPRLLPTVGQRRRPSAPDPKRTLI